MRLEGDKIVIESRYEIDEIINMIELYKEKGDPRRLTKEELTDLQKKLDGLYMTW